MCLIDGSHDLFGDFLHLFSLGVQSLWPVNRFVFANLQVCADRLGPAPNTVTVGIMKVNKGPFIQMNRLITHCYRVLATPQPDRYSQQTVLPFFPRWSFWAQSMKRQYLIGRKEDTKEMYKDKEIKFQWVILELWHSQMCIYSMNVVSILMIYITEAFVHSRLSGLCKA